MLKITHLSKTFNPGTVNEKPVLQDLSLHIEKGDFVTVIGANGAGKSTLFNAVSGSFIADSGKIFLDGKDITLMPEYKRARDIGRLFQDPMRGSAPGMTIEENLALAAGHGGWLSTVSKADKKLFREIEVFVPPFEEQKRIVKKIDEILAEKNKEIMTV